MHALYALAYDLVDGRHERRDADARTRRLLRTPAFAATAVVMLTLSVGSTAAIFSLLHALVLRPLPVPAPEELVQVSTRDRLGREADR